MEHSESSLEKITESLETAITGIPAPVRKNFSKAFNQLCTAAIDIPVAWLEGKSAEIRASSEARVNIIKTGGESISEKLDVPKEYILKASEKYASKIIKERLILDEITHNAAKDLTDKNIKENDETKAEISDEWLNEFEDYAKLKSSEEMKLIFGKILSGEIMKPGSFSIRTVRLISQLDNEAAKLFQLLCSLTVSLHYGDYLTDARVISINGNAGSNSLSKFGLPFASLNILHEYGLIISDYNSYNHFSYCVANENNQVVATMRLNNKYYGLIPTDKEKYDKVLKLYGVALTKSGKELLSIIPLLDRKDYKLELEGFFNKKHLKMEEVIFE